MTVYERCRKYARKCCPDLEIDIVHQAFILHHKTHGTNLFDKDIYVALRWVKNVWFNILNETRYVYNHEKHYYQFQEVSTSWPSGSKTDGELITKDFYENLFKQIDEYQAPKHKGRNNPSLGASLDPKILRRFAEMLNEGWTIPEISKETGYSSQRLNYYKLKLREIIKHMEVNNPFAGNKARPIKKINLKQYNEKYKDEYEMNFDREWCDENETSMLVAHKEREEYILVKLTKD
jgi:hypothetical protein